MINIEENSRLIPGSRTHLVASRAARTSGCRRLVRSTREATQCVQLPGIKRSLYSIIIYITKQDTLHLSAYMAMLIILQLTHTASSVYELQNKYRILPEIRARPVNSASPCFGLVSVSNLV